MQLRQFPASVVELGRQWSTGAAIADLKWTAGPARFGGTTRAFEATSTIARGVAKPGSLDIEPAHHAVAAHEKICADLAFALELPVPPATLWHRRGAPVGHSQHVVVSAFPFDQLYPWGFIASQPSLAGHFAASLSDAASAMAAFDTWVGNPDRFNEGNLLVSPQRAAAYLDFANALSFGWKKAGFQDPHVVTCYPAQVATNLDAMSVIVAKISELPREIIVAVVDRIPRAFLPEPERSLIVGGLLYRQSELRKYMRQRYPNLP